MIIIHRVNSVLPRLLEPEIGTALREAPVLVLTGARQTGKSTLVQRGGPARNRLYLSLDDLDVLGDAESAPAELARRAPRLTLDEVQRVPKLLHAIKRAVDERRTPGRFLLTGSANLALHRRVAESLAGRALSFTLWPLTRRERLGLGSAGRWDDLFHTPTRAWPELLGSGTDASEDWRDAARMGGYPTPAYELRDHAARQRWFAGYSTTYLERDVVQLAAIHNVIEFRRLMRALCLRLGTLVNQTELGRDIGLKQPTVHRYLGLLEASYQLVRLPAYAVNRTKRLIKTPKTYWSDVGLAMHMAGETEPRGPHLENLVLADLLAWSGAKAERPDVLYWRTAAGEEVDFVLEWKRRLVAVEVKAAARVSTADARSLASFIAEYGSAVAGGIVLYTGREVIRLGERVVAAPWWRVV